MVKLLGPQEQQKFLKHIIKEGKIDNPGGGDCLFYSILGNNIKIELEEDPIYNDIHNINELQVQDLRLLISMKLQSLVYDQEFLNVSIREYLRSIDRDAFCQWISEVGNWQGNGTTCLEIILKTVSILFKINIVLLCKYTNSSKISSYVYSDHKFETINSKRRIFLYFTGSDACDGHYQTIRVMEDTFAHNIHIYNFTDSYTE